MWFQSCLCITLIHHIYSTQAWDLHEVEMPWKDFYLIRTHKLVVYISFQYHCIVFIIHFFWIILKVICNRRLVISLSLFMYRKVLRPTGLHICGQTKLTKRHSIFLFLFSFGKSIWICVINLNQVIRSSAHIKTDVS